ncbi:MAG: hypothetical protein ACM3JQ_01810 [Candidatus Eiseniibacteriota bacterium]
MPSDISETIELDLTQEHNLIIQPIASPAGQQIQISGTIPLQTHPGNLIKFQLRENKGVLRGGSSKEANVQTLHTPHTIDIFERLISSINASNEKGKEQIAILLGVLRDNLTPGASENQDLVEKLKQISVDKENFELAWTRASPLRSSERANQQGNNDFGAAHRQLIIN